MKRRRINEKEKGEKEEKEETKQETKEEQERRKKSRREGRKVGEIHIQNLAKIGFYVFKKLPSILLTITLFAIYIFNV